MVELHDSGVKWSYWHRFADGMGGKEAQQILESEYPNRDVLYPLIRVLAHRLTLGLHIDGCIDMCRDVCMGMGRGMRVDTCV